MTTFEHPAPPAGPPERPEGLGPYRPRAAEAGDPDRWHPLTAFGALLFGLAVVLVISMMVAAVAAAFGADLDDPPAWMNIVLTGVQGAIFVGAGLFFARRVAVPRARDFGLRAPRSVWAAVGLVPAVYGAFLAVSAIWVAIIGVDTDDDLPDELGADESDLALVAVGILVTVIAPVGEEFLFRGYMFRALRNWRGVWPAALLSGAVFGAIHLVSADLVALLPLAVLGTGMALIYHWTGSLYTAIALHALNNAIAFSVSQDWDWQVPLVIVGALAASLTVGRALGQAIEAARERARPSAEEPAPGI